MGRPPIGRPEGRRTFVDELLGELRAARWSVHGWRRLVARSLERSWRDAARRPGTLAELTLVHLALGAARPGLWPPATWALAVTHLGMLDEGDDHLGWADRFTLLRANLPGLVRRRTAWTGPLALATDWIDGRLARRTRTTAFGAYADAIADVAFWTWYVHRHETSRPLRLAADLLWVGPAAGITAAYLACGRAVDYPRPVALRNLSVALQGVVTLRALACARRDHDHGRRAPRCAFLRATRHPGAAHPEHQEIRCPRRPPSRRPPDAMPTTSSTS